MIDDTGTPESPDARPFPGTSRTRLPAAFKPGGLVRLTSAASPQFDVRPIYFKVIRVEPPLPHAEWVWVHGYEVDENGRPTCVREVYVRIDGLKPVTILVT